jgi:hypothetical protein
MKERIQKVVILSVACVVAFGLGEIMARAFLPVPGRVVVKKTTNFGKGLWEGTKKGSGIVLNGRSNVWGRVFLSTETGRRLRPNLEVMVENHPFSGRTAEIRTNSLGMRNREIGPKAKKRILFLGDSITLADYLPEEETFVRLVEGEAQRHGVDWETINGGVSAIGLKEDLAILIETGLLVDPDVVVVGFYLNDWHQSPGVYVPRLPGLLSKSWLIHFAVLTTSQYLAYFESTRRLNDLNYYSVKGIDLARWRRDFQRAFPAAPGDYRREKYAFNSVILQTFPDWGAAWSEHAWNHMYPLFAEFKRLSVVHGFQLFLIAFPVRPQVEADFVYDYPQRQLKQIAGESAIPVLDMLPILRKAHRESSEELFYDVCHHTSYGSRIIAKAISDFLRTNLSQRLGAES